MAGDEEPARLRWEQRTARTWVLVDDRGNGMQVAKLAHFNYPVKYVVTGTETDYEATEYPSLADAMAAAEASLRSLG
jgi:hypothetical protein